MSFTMANLLKCRVLAGFVCSALFASFVGGQQPPTTSAADTPASKHIFEFGGNSRTYSCFIPKVEGALPVVVLLHGSGRNGQVMIDAWKDLAAKEHFIAVAPDAYNSAGWAFRTDSPEFFHAVVEQVKAMHAVDETRIYLFGHSAGAVHALVLAVVDSRYYAAAAVHSGALPPGYEKLLFAQADRRMPIAIWVGDRDPLFSVEAVEATKRQFEANGFQVKVSVIADHDHNYYAISSQVNHDAWEFVKAARLVAPVAAGRQ